MTAILLSYCMVLVAPFLAFREYDGSTAGLAIFNGSVLIIVWTLICGLFNL